MSEIGRHTSGLKREKPGYVNLAIHLNYFCGKHFAKIFIAFESPYVEVSRTTPVWQVLKNNDEVTAWNFHEFFTNWPLCPNQKIDFCPNQPIYHLSLSPYAQKWVLWAHIFFWEFLGTLCSGKKTVACSKHVFRPKLAIMPKPNSTVWVCKVGSTLKF